MDTLSIPGATLVQAWEWTQPGAPGGYVYTRELADQRAEQGATVKPVAIARWHDGSQTYLPGTIAAAKIALRPVPVHAARRTY